MVHAAVGGSGLCDTVGNICWELSIASQMYGCYSVVAQKHSCKQRARKSYSDVIKCL